MLGLPGYITVSGDYATAQAVCLKLSVCWCQDVICVHSSRRVVGEHFGPTPSCTVHPSIDLTCPDVAETCRPRISADLALFLAWP